MKRIISGIQSSNQLTLGNYLGAIKSYFQLQNQYDSYIFVADLHVITNPKIDFKQLKENKKKLVCLYYACGLDLKKNHVFFQSEVPAHSELAHILMCHSTMGELNRMTQFKDKASKFTNANGSEMIPAGLFTYPILMVADILLYDADIVPVGIDQKQHLELTRNLAIRLNNKYGKMFNLPEPYIPQSGAKIMDLVNPETKMSKSNENPKGVIYLLDDINVSIKKIMSAKTDNLNQVKYDLKNQPGVSNLINIYNALTSLPIKEIENKYKNKNYGEFKKDLSELLKKELGSIKDKYDQAYANYESEILPILNANAKLVNEIANKKLTLIHKKIGIK